MSIKVMTQVWEHSQMKGSALLLLLAIADFADDDGIAYPGTETLAKKIRMSERQVKRLRQTLYESGELEYISGGNAPGDRLNVRVTSCPKGDKSGHKGDTGDTQRVTNRVNKGDKSGQIRVTRVSPEPPIEPSGEPSYKPPIRTTTTTGGGRSPVSFAEVARMYESEIGMFTALTSDMVQSDFDTYGGEWLMEAIAIAVNANKRKWNYVQGILNRWKVEGKQKPAYVQEGKKLIIAKLAEEVIV